VLNEKAISLSAMVCLQWVFVDIIVDNYGAFFFSKIYGFTYFGDQTKLVFRWGLVKLREHAARGLLC